MDSLVFRVVADSSGVRQGVTESQGILKRGMATLKDYAVIGYAAAGAAALKFGQDAVKAANEAEQAQKDLEEAYRRFPKIQDLTLRKFNELADATLEKSRYDDDAARSAIGLLAQYDLTGKQIQSLLPVLIDYATKTGQDLPEAAKALGNALLGNTRGLKGVGLEMTMTGDRSVDLAALIEGLQAKVGGAAAADLDTYAGKWEQLKNRWGEIQEQAGGPLLAALEALIDFTNNYARPAVEWLTDAYGNLKRGLENLPGPLATVGQFLSGVAAYLVESWRNAERLATIFGNLWTAATELAASFGDVVGMLKDLSRWAGNALGPVGDLLDALKRVWDLKDRVGGFFGGFVPGLLAAPAPTVAAGAATYATGASSSWAPSSSGIRLEVHVHGNVGDPAVVGRRAVEALEAYVRTNGARRVQQLTTPTPTAA